MRSARRRGLVGAGALAAVAAVLLVTVVSEPSAPVTVVTDAIRWVLGPSVSPRHVERAVAGVANVALFVPLGATVALLVGRSRAWLGLGGCAALSVAIEVVQALWLPRTAQVSDVVLNTVGSVAGWIAVRAWRERSRSDEGGTAGPAT